MRLDRVTPDYRGVLLELKPMTVTALIYSQPQNSIQGYNALVVLP